MNHTPTIPETNRIYDKVVEWWNNLRYTDKRYYVGMYEGGCVPVASLSSGAIIRLYFKVIEHLSSQEAFEKYHKLKFNEQ